MLDRSVAVTRSTLYVPGDRPDRFAKALASGADAIILDLEDSVAEDHKSTARMAVAEWLGKHPGAAAWVRVNNRPDLLAEDLAMVREVSPQGIVLPKAEPESCRIDDLKIVALVESGAGVLALSEMAQLPAVTRLALGEADLCADLGIRPSLDNRELWAIRSQVVVVSAAHGLDAAAGPVHTNLDDLDELRDTSQALCQQGFGGRSAIHPAQVPIINDAFAPTPEEITWANAVIDAFAGGAAVVNGEFIDPAVVRRAQALLDHGVEP